MREEKGITLIALVITIIVMLILAAVTITLVVNGNLVNHARDAKSDTQAAIDNETLISQGTVKYGEGEVSTSIQNIVDNTVTVAP